MFRIHVARNHKSIGQFSAEEVAEGLQTGEFLPTDLAWRDPMDAWKPLAEFTDLPQVEISVPLPPSLPEVAVAPPIVIEPAWERRAEVGWVAGLIQTVQQVLAAPAATFKVMKCEGGFGTPLWFHVILLALTTWVAIAYQMAALKVNPDAVLGTMASQITPEEMQGSLIIFLALSPVFIVVGVFATAAIVHLVLMAFGGVKKPFEATFRGVCYALAPASLFQLIPMCGGVIYLVTGLMLLTVALREIHKTDTLRATMSVTFPAVLCCGLFLGLYALTATAALSQGIIK